MKTVEQKKFETAVGLLQEAINSRPAFEFQMISDSMSPLIDPRDICVAEPREVNRLRCGDIIIVNFRGNLTAHRFLKAASACGILTKGDRLARPDSFLPQEALIAKIRIIKKPGVSIDLNKPFWKLINRLIGKLSLSAVQRKTGVIKALWLGILGILFAGVRSYFALMSFSKSFNAEKEIAVLLSQTSLRREDQQALTAYFRQKLDWNYIYQSILYNRTASLTLKNLEQLRSEYIPDWVIQNLKTIDRENTVKSEIIRRDVSRLLTEFQNRNIDVILLKGLALAGDVFGNLNLRPMEDVDILVKKKDWENICAILKGLDFQNKENLDLLKLSALSSVDLNWHVDHQNQNGTKLELKFSLFVLDCPDFPSPDSYWHNARPFFFEGVKTLCLSPEDNCVYLAGRMINAGFRNLLWFRELAGLIDKEPLDWNAVVKKAKERHVDIFVYLSLRILKEKFGSQIPDFVLNKLWPFFLKRILFQRLFKIRDCGFLNPRHLLPKVDPLVYCLLAKWDFRPENFGRILRFVRCAVFPPKDYLRCRYGKDRPHLRRLILPLRHWGRMMKLLLFRT